MPEINNRILRVDVSTGTITEESCPPEAKYLGGRALTSHYVSREVPARCNPLGPFNKLILAPGLLAGTPLSSSNRLSAGAMSPLTGGIKESNSGGVGALRLSRLGIRSLIIEGACEDRTQPRGLRLAKDGNSIEDLSEFRGMSTYDTASALLDRYGRKCGLLLIGPAGEMLLSTSSIHVNDPEGEPCRVLARGGLGAVMASKGLKAIILDDSGCADTISKTEQGRSAIKDFAEKLRKNEVTGRLFAKYGTARTLGIVNGLGGLPTRNFSAGEFEGADELDGEKLYEVITERGGQAAHACMPGCLIRCSNKYVRANGEPLVGSLDYETLCLLGSNLGISDMDCVAEMNLVCNQIGIDTMETGAALGVLADAGLFSFGDGKRALELVREVGEGTPLGRLIGSGSTVCGKVYGNPRVPAAKGQGMAAYDPRVIKGNGVTYATSTMGADHTAGNTIIKPLDHAAPGGKILESLDLQVFTTVLDSLGLCIFTSRVVLENPDLIERILSAYFEWDTTFDALLDLGKATLRDERRFNEKVGLEKDRLPEFFSTEPIGPHELVFDVDPDELEQSYSRFLKEQP